VVTPAPDNGPGSSNRADRLKSLRKKLSKLNRQPLPDGPPVVPRPEPTPGERRVPDTILYRRDLPTEAPRRVREGGGICLPLEQCLDGCETQSSHGPPFYLVERSMAKAKEEPQGHLLPEMLARALEALARRAAAEGQPPTPIPPEQVCFLDLETTGLGCCPVFLVGTLVCRGREMVCRQFLARDYAEEISIVCAFVEQARQPPLLVTFNGKTFDAPFLRTRAAATGVAFPEPAGHLDLLHEARRVFRDRLPNCKLQTLERHVCQRRRGDDIPGSEIPAAYHDFVHTGDARQIAQIVRHNQWDLVTMVHLMERILLAP